MAGPTAPVDGGGLRALASRTDCQAALRDTLAAAIERGARRLWAVDPDFDAWPLDAMLPTDAFTAWLRQPLRRLVVVAGDYSGFERRHPRFTAWRRHWTHAIDTLTPEEGFEGEVPRLLVDDGPLSVQIVDAVHWRGSGGADARQAGLLRQQVDALLQRSGPAFPAYTAGL